MHHCLNSLQRSKSSVVGVAIDDFCRNRLLVEGSGGAAPSGAAFDSVAVAPLLVAAAVAAT